MYLRSSYRYGPHLMLSVQYALTLALATDATLVPNATARANVQDTLENVVMKRFPYPEWSNNQFAAVAASIVPIALLTPLLFVASGLTKDIVRERETKITISMQMMGVSDGVLWTSWILRGVVPMVASMAIVTTVGAYLHVGVRIYRIC